MFYFYILSGILIALLVYLIYIIKQTQNDRKIFEKFNEIDYNIQNRIFTSVDSVKTGLINNFNNIDYRIEKRLSDEFLKTTNTFAKLSERIAKIDESQKTIEKLSEDIVSLQKILTDKKTRGIFGEIQLNHILENIFGIDNKGILYDLQYPIDDKRVDAVVINDTSLIPIDSKFPLENFNRILDGNTDRIKDFKNDIKKHINDIATKYIIRGITEQAILFLPAESIYAYVVGNQPDILEYAYKKKVWIVSPTTLMAILTSIQNILLEKERVKNLSLIHTELIKFSKEFEMYNKRWNNIYDNIKKLNKSIDEFEITNNKIIKNFEKIKNVELDK